MRTLVLTPLVVLLSGCGLANGDLAAQEHFERDVPLEAAGVFELDNVNGRVEVAPWDRNLVRIEAEKAASSQRDLREIRIEVQGEGGRVTVKTRYPRGGFFSRAVGRVNYRIQLPATVRARIQNVNGEIRIDGLEGTVAAKTVNGSVRVMDAAGSLEASTVNGSIRAEYRRVGKDGSHDFSTTNGSVTLSLPPQTTGAFDVRTVNGGIHTDLPLEVSGKVGKHLRGRVGEGGPSFRVRTVNGAVKLVKWGEKEV